MRKKDYPGGDIAIEQELEPGSNYNRYIVSYKSEGLKINALLTVPQEEQPQEGFPVIIFNHGYIPPEQYRTTERYVAYLDSFAKNGYIVLKPDYRGHGDSEGNPEGAYFSPAYTTDILNALSSIKKYEDVNPEKIGMWGHSLGGHITLRSMVVSKDIKAGVIWGGVVGSYSDMFDRFFRNSPWSPSAKEQQTRRLTRQRFIDEYGTPEQNPQFWNSISPNSYLADISGPVQLHHGLSDETVPWQLSENLYNSLKSLGKEVEFFNYQNGDHNLSSPNFEEAMERSISFFDKYLKS
ncbi:alpha/beta fold hydrolase [Candidatus Daviesbacteria bacterium]|nr:alpha/beta fold hydrolase [Candidatus Daviesbacteria bacterium]